MKQLLEFLLNNKVKQEPITEFLVNDNKVKQEPITEFLVNKPIKSQAKKFEVVKENPNDIPIVRIYDINDVKLLIKDKQQQEKGIKDVNYIINSNDIWITKYVKSKETIFTDLVIGFSFHKNYTEKSMVWSSDADKYNIIDTIYPDNFSKEYFIKNKYDTYNF